jgi:sugar/nucleoside kinase (ribokinase family)
MEYLVAAAADRAIRLYAVLTTSLPADFVADRVLPATHSIFASWDEASWITGLESEQSIECALAHLNWLRETAPQATIFLTMGEEGVLVAGSSSSLIHHVRLDRHWADVQQLVSQDATRLCGAGDCFAAGASVYLETGATRLAGIASVPSDAVGAALAGCAAAVRWLGSVLGLTARDFDVMEFPLAACRPRYLMNSLIA